MKELDIIFDTDAGSDCDDTMALGYLIYAQRNLGIRIKAVTHSLPRPYGAAALRGTFRYFGEQAPAIGVMAERNDAPTDNYIQQLDELFAAAEDRVAAPNAVSVLRRALAECEDKAVICAVGPLSNIADLLKSAPDDISPLNGVELVAEKCSRIVTMAGIFVPSVERVEWNVKCDIPAAQTVVKLCPVPIFWLPFETGLDIMTGKGLRERYGMASPISASFILFKWCDEEGRHSWDPATALYTVEGEREFFRVEHGAVTVRDDGITEFCRDEKADGGIILVNAGGDGEAAAKKRIADHLNTVVESIY